MNIIQGSDYSVNDTESFLFNHAYVHGLYFINTGENDATIKIYGGPIDIRPGDTNDIGQEYTQEEIDKHYYLISTTAISAGAKNFADISAQKFTYFQVRAYTNTGTTTLKFFTMKSGEFVSPSAESSPSPGGSTALSDLTDCDINSSQNFEGLTYLTSQNGWVNMAPQYRPLVQVTSATYTVNPSTDYCIVVRDNEVAVAVTLPSLADISAAYSYLGSEDYAATFLVIAENNSATVTLDADGDDMSLNGAAYTASVVIPSGKICTCVYISTLSLWTVSHS